MLRQAEGRYNQSYFSKIENSSQTNPKFGNKLHNLGPKKDVKINKIYKNGILTSDRQDILDQWYKDFSSLYNLSSVKTYEHTKFADNIMK